MRKVTIPGHRSWRIEAADHDNPDRVEITVGSERSPSMFLAVSPEHALELASALRLEALVVLAQQAPEDRPKPDPWTCSVISEADGVEDGFIGVRCGQPAVIVDVETDLGYCPEHTMNATGTVTVLA